jgi:predicted nucleic acid-binding protein
LNYLIDTNVISEIRKRDRCDSRVAAWYASIDESSIYLSVLVLGEIRRGIERIRRTDPAQARALEAWLNQVTKLFGDRILPVDHAVADAWGRMGTERPLATIDSLLAATAKVNGMALVTRNAPDVAGLDVSVLNPFEWHE